MMRWILALGAILILSSCSEVVIRVTEIPENTPKGADLFLCGNFNFWDTADEDYRLRLGPDSAWYASVPAGIGEVHFWVTRGDWSSIEADGCGNRIAQRNLLIHETDTFSFLIDSWIDREALKCGLVTIVIDSLPDGSGEGQEIILAGDFNNWNTEDTTFKARKDEATGKYMVTIPRPLDKIDYKYIITQGDLRAAEADDYGQLRAPRSLTFGREDTISIAVERWESQAAEEDELFTIILESVPENTPSYEPIYIACNMNEWFPRDKNWKMNKRPDGSYVLNIPRSDRYLSFKFTRGDWKSVEGDENGNEIGNRELRISSNSKARFKVLSWKDLYNAPEGDMTLKITLPEAINKDESLYISGDFNGWTEVDPKYKLQKEGDKLYSLKIPKALRGSHFKIHRGSWAKQECDSRGIPRANRVLRPNSKDVIEVEPSHWLDLIWEKDPYVTFIINDYPKKTPEDETIYLATDLNDWKLSYPDYQFKRNAKGEYELRFRKPKSAISMEFKINRGSWDNVEKERFGAERYNRMYDFAVGDTIYLDIKAWADL